MFGGFTDANDGTPHTFDSTVTPSCGAGHPVLFDVSSNNSLQQDDAWGINFKPPDVTTAPNLTISTIVIDLLPTGHNDTDSDAFFDFFDVEPPNPTVTLANLQNAPVISGNSGPKIALPACAVTQADNFGIDATALTATDLGGGVFTFSNSQIEFRFDTNDPSKLTINFSDDGIVVDDGFEPGDRFRFGAKVENLDNKDFKPNNRANDGDEIGRVGVQVTVTFAIAKAIQATMGLRVDDEAELQGLDQSQHAESAYTS